MSVHVGDPAHVEAGVVGGAPGTAHVRPWRTGWTGASGGRQSRAMEILVLGGSGFLSGAVVEAAVAQGHQVTTVTRAGTPSAPGVTALHADRDDADALRAALQGRPAPDAVVDCCGFTVAGARAAAAALAHVPRYVYVSSISAYAGWPPGPVPDESAPTFGPEADASEYGPMKAESERVLTAAFGERVLHARAGLIVGPGDRTRRLTTWLHRCAHDDVVVVPEAADLPIAVVDVRDLATWLVTAAAETWSGPVNATGPEGMTTFGGLLDACRDAVVRTEGRAGTLRPVPDDVLLAAGVEPWRDLPFWLPDDVARTAWQMGTARARELGLPTRPIEETVAATWAWQREVGLDHPAAAPSVVQVADGPV